MHIAAAIAAAHLAMCPPAVAAAPSLEAASTSFDPWVAAGLTYVPIAPASLAAAFATGITSPTVWLNSGSFIATNPMPGLGHLYVGEPARGLGFFGAGLSLLVATVAANVTLFQGRRPLESPTSWQEQARDGVNFTYLATSTALSLWAAWDAYKIAETKNQPGTRPKP